MLRDVVAELAANARDRREPLYVERPVTNPQELVRWLSEIGYPERLRHDPKKWHVTVVYSRDPVVWNARKPMPNNLRVTGEGRRTETFGESNVLLLTSRVLQMEWQQFRDIGASWDFPTYQPHITVGEGWDGWRNIPPFAGTLILGPQRFAALED